MPVHCKFCGIAHESGHNGCSGWPNYGDPRRESDAWITVTRRAEEIRENTGCSWESACARAELEAELSTIANR